MLCSMLRYSLIILNNEFVIFDRVCRILLISFAYIFVITPLLFERFIRNLCSMHTHAHTIKLRLEGRIKNRERFDVCLDKTKIKQLGNLKLKWIRKWDNALNNFFKNSKSMVIDSIVHQRNYFTMWHFLKSFQIVCGQRMHILEHGNKI